MTIIRESSGGRSPLSPDSGLIEESKGDNFSQKIKVSSFSKVIIDQLKLMTDGLNQGLVFKVRAIKEKNYYKFEEVE